jgi:hypothetical protein
MLLLDSFSFVLDCLETTGADTFSHFEMLIDEHRIMEMEGSSRPSRLKQLVPTVGTFHTYLPLRHAFELYNEKHRLTRRKHIQISFNEVGVCGLVRSAEETWRLFLIFFARFPWR